MTERATFKYSGGEQSIRIGCETFLRNVDTLVTDPDVIAEARQTAEVGEDVFPVADAPVEEAVAPEPVAVAVVEPAPVEPEPEPAQEPPVEAPVAEAPAPEPAKPATPAK